MKRVRLILCVLLVTCVITQVYAYNTIVTLEVTNKAEVETPGNTGSNSGNTGDNKDTGNIMGGYTSDNKFIRTSSSDIAPNKERIAQGYINGYPDKTFRPDKELTREEYAVMIYRILKFEPREVNVVFTDVGTEHWSYKEVTTLAAYSIIEGIGNGKYEPYRSLTVEEAVLIIDRILSTDKYNKSCDIRILGTDKGKEAIKRCYNIGLLNDIVIEREINGKRPISRWEIVSILNRVVYRNSLSTKDNRFIDIDTNSRYYMDVVKATYTNIVYKQLSAIHNIKYCAGVQNLPIFIY